MPHLYNIFQGMSDLVYEIQALSIAISRYLSAKEIAEKWNISRRRVQILCEEGRIPGAFKLSDVWVIPKDAEKPADRRKAKKKTVNGEVDKLVSGD